MLVEALEAGLNHRIQEVLLLGSQMFIVTLIMRPTYGRKIQTAQVLAQVVEQEAKTRD